MVEGCKEKGDENSRGRMRGQVSWLGDNQLGGTGRQEAQVIAGMDVREGLARKEEVGTKEKVRCR